MDDLDVSQVTKLHLELLNINRDLKKLESRATTAHQQIEMMGREIKQTQDMVNELRASKKFKAIKGTDKKTGD